MYTNNAEGGFWGNWVLTELEQKGSSDMCMRYACSAIYVTSTFQGIYFNATATQSTTEGVADLSVTVC